MSTSLTARYHRAAPAWGGIIDRLGYPAAYRAAIRAALAGRPAPAQVLDYGCGTGAMAEALLDTGHRPECLTLLDPAAAMVARARDRLAPRHGTLESLIGTEADLPPDSRFDLILIAHVLEHLPEPHALLARLGQRLTPGGEILLIASRPHWCNWVIWMRWRHRSFAPEDINRMADGAGRAIRLERGFECGPPSRTSRAYVLTRKES